jgi:hypothetical protein
VPTMKVTPSAAMRARDVSRPHAEHLAWAEEAEATGSGAGAAGTPGAARAAGQAGAARAAGQGGAARAAGQGGAARAAGQGGAARAAGQAGAAGARPEPDDARQPERTPGRRGRPAGMRRRRRGGAGRG